MNAGGKRHLEHGLWVIGLALIGCATSEWVVARAAQVENGRRAVNWSNVSLPVTHGQEGAAFGRLTCRPIGLSVPITDGYDVGSLLHGVGHVTGSATAGGLGNMVLAGHRDTYFRALRQIRPGMKLQVESSGGRFLYSVDRTEIVAPSAVQVTEIGEQPELTLITCYPFDFIGSAPMRFIVHAHLASDPG